MSRQIAPRRKKSYTYESKTKDKDVKYKEYVIYHKEGEALIKCG